MVDFASRFGKMARNSRSKTRELWQRLFQDLNAAGPQSRRKVEKWN